MNVAPSALYRIGRKNALSARSLKQGVDSLYNEPNAKRLI